MPSKPYDTVHTSRQLVRLSGRTPGHLRLGRPPEAAWQGRARRGTTAAICAPYTSRTARRPARDRAVKRRPEHLDKIPHPDRGLHAARGDHALRLPDIKGHRPRHAPDAPPAPADPVRELRPRPDGPLAAPLQAAARPADRPVDLGADVPAARAAAGGHARVAPGVPRVGALPLLRDCVGRGRAEPTLAHGRLGDAPEGLEASARLLE